MRLEHENKKLKSHQKDEQDEQVHVDTSLSLSNIIFTPGFLRMMSLLHILNRVMWQCANIIFLIHVAAILSWKQTNFTNAGNLRQIFLRHLCTSHPVGAQSPKKLINNRFLDSATTKSLGRCK